MATVSRETIPEVEQLKPFACSLCGLSHGAKTGPKIHKKAGKCSICDQPRDSSGRYCKRCRAQYMRGHRKKLTPAPALVENEAGLEANQVKALD